MTHAILYNGQRIPGAEHALRSYALNAAHLLSMTCGTAIECFRVVEVASAAQPELIPALCGRCEKRAIDTELYAAHDADRYCRQCNNSLGEIQDERNAAEAF